MLSFTFQDSLTAGQVVRKSPRTEDMGLGKVAKVVTLNDKQQMKLSMYLTKICRLARHIGALQDVEATALSQISVIRLHCNAFCVVQKGVTTLQQNFLFLSNIRNNRAFVCKLAHQHSKSRRSSAEVTSFTIVGD